MTINTYQVGQVVRLTDVVTVGGVITDPTGAYEFRIKEPDGTLTTYVYPTDNEVVKDGVGSYHVDFLITQAGVHHWGPAAGVGIAEGANQTLFRVETDYLIA